jgi:hypothetical protein
MNLVQSRSASSSGSQRASHALRGCGSLHTTNWLSEAQPLRSSGARAFFSGATRAGEDCRGACWARLEFMLEQLAAQ